MAASSGKLYDRAVEGIGDQTDDWDTTAKYVMLLNSTHTFTPANTLLNQISANEVTGTGYSKKNLPTLSVDTAAAGIAKFKAGNVSWTSSTISNIRYAAILQGAAATPNPTADTLICSVTLETADLTTSNGTFLITWNADGVFTLDHTP